MLILTRRVGECLTIGNDIVIQVKAISGTQVRIGIDAPLGIQILRDDAKVKTRDRAREAAADYSAAEGITEL